MSMWGKVLMRPELSFWIGAFWALTLLDQALTSFDKVIGLRQRGALTDILAWEANAGFGWWSLLLGLGFGLLIAVVAFVFEADAAKERHGGITRACSTGLRIFYFLVLLAPVANNLWGTIQLTLFH